jgi:hypothetical protein
LLNKEEKLNKIYIGIDNGVSGSIGIIGNEEPQMFKTPIIVQQSYTKRKQNISRLDVNYFKKIMLECFHYSTLAILERPMVNPVRFKASMSAMRCLESQLTILEALDIPYMYIDSKEWQKVLLPQGCQKEKLKKASLDIGLRLFPALSETIIEQRDADSILIAEWARRKNL